MKKNRAVIVACALVLLTILLVRYFGPRVAWHPPPGRAGALSPPGKRMGPESNSQAGGPSGPALPSEPRSPLADALNSPDTDIGADLRLLEQILGMFRSNFHANPAGNNAEITGALTGKNPLKLALIPPDHPALNPQHELCDRWGQPFFFHQVSATQMEIRSAGPDKKMWTDDDQVLTP